MIYVWLGIGVVLISIIMSYIEVRGNFYKIGAKQQLTVEFRAFKGLLRYKYKLPKKKVNQEAGILGIEARLYRYYVASRDHIHNYTMWMNDVSRHLTCTALHWKTEIGTGEAPSTAIVLGVIWAIKTSLASYGVNKVKTMVSPDLRVIPNYDKVCLNTEIEIHVRVRQGIALLLMVKLAYLTLEAKLKARRKRLTGRKGMVKG